MGTVSGNTPSMSDSKRMGRVAGVPLTKMSAPHRRALQPAFERCAMPVAMATARKLKLPKWLCVVVPLGAPAVLSWVAASVCSGLTGGVNDDVTTSKLAKIEA